MRIFEIAQTSYTPFFMLDYENGLIVYKGRFIPEIDPVVFMKPLRESIEKYITSPLPVTKLEVFYEYVNTGNMYTLLEFFKLIKKISDTGNELICKWHFDDPSDEDSIDMCEDVVNYTGLEFELIDDSMHIFVE